jgi:hypothetical protein
MSDNKAQDQQAVENSRGLFSHGSDQHRKFLSSQQGVAGSSSLVSKPDVEAMKDHQCHHYMSTYGGYAARALIMGFAGTLGADAANAMVGEARKEWDKK